MTTPPPPRRSRPAAGWTIPVLLSLVSIVALVTIGVAAAALIDRPPGPQTVTFVVPEGTTQRYIDGEDLDLMPEEVQLKVGDTLVVRNDDAETVTVGPFTVRAGETLTQEFRRPQELIGDCTLSGSGEVRIVVT